MLGRGRAAVCEGAVASPRHVGTFRSLDLAVGRDLLDGIANTLMEFLLVPTPIDYPTNDHVGREDDETPDACHKGDDRKD